MGKIAISKKYATGPKESGNMFSVYGEIWFSTDSQLASCIDDIRMSVAAQFSNVKTVSLETYRKNGEAVRSPVWIVEDSGKLFIRTDPNSWKAKRIRKNPSVRLAPSDMRGNVKGEWVKGEASFVVDQEESGRVLKLFSKKYGLMGKLVGLRGGSSVVLTIKV